MCERVWRIASDCAKKQGLAIGFHGWLVACKLPESCTRAKHARSWRVAPAVALQEKSLRLAKLFARGLNSQLNPIVRSSHQNTLFGKKTEFSHSFSTYYIYTIISTILIELFHLHGQRLVLCGWKRSLKLNRLFCFSSTLILSI